MSIYAISNIFFVIMIKVLDTLVYFATGRILYLYISIGIIWEKVIYELSHAFKIGTRREIFYLQLFLLRA